jgi:hypothetical protein
MASVSDVSLNRNLPYYNMVLIRNLRFGLCPPSAFDLQASSHLVRLEAILVVVVLAPFPRCWYTFRRILSPRTAPKRIATHGS